MSAAYIWTVIVGLGLFTYAIRLSFLGMTGARAPSAAMVRLLRYVPTAVLPAMVAPMVAFDRAGGGLSAPSVWLAAAAAIAVGAVTRHLLGTIVAGMAALHLLRALGL